MPRHCLTLDLRDDAHAISEYKRYHEKIWPEVKESLFTAGVLDMEIYLLETRMFMIMDVSDEFTMARKATMDLANPKVQEWETIMHGFQQDLPWAKPGEKWIPMEKVFSLAAQ
ncbi:L-rhamnose mutarotase [Granulicella arctica]|uniref:L-rhamnose mutarotase n=1 Tax=Granulicella arctica TaxID=940613 RepID=A0A7Y9TM33_9BACT|nr:L-rhamnose mutarotase [Granulicella arctica]NYF80742.1 L-rhamnose mutarotase [Granulicella arctica]